MTTRLCIKNVPKHADEKRIREFFQRKGQVTDVKLLHAPDGKPRQMAFVGFRTPEEAAEALRYYNGAFFDTSKLIIETARPISAEAPAAARPWSKYSKGSSAYARRNPLEAAADGVEKPPAAPSRSNLLDEALSDVKNDEAFQKFMELSKPRKGAASTKAWAAASVGGPSGPDETSSKTVVQKDAVTSLRYGSRGEQVERTRIRFADDSEAGSSSDSEEYQDLPVARDGAASDREDDSSESSDSEDRSDRLAKNKTKKPADLASKWESTFRLKESSSPPSSEEDSSPHSSEMEEDHGHAPLSEDSESSSEEDGNEEAEAREERRDDVDSESGRLFVRNLGYSATEEEVQQLFETVGPVAEVHIPIDAGTRRSKGLAFVRYVQPEDAVRALRKLDGSSFQGRLLHILPAKRLASGDASSSTAELRSTTKYKDQKRAAQAESAGSSHNWNPLMMRSSAVVDAVAHMHGLARGDVLDPEADNLATRMAVAETRVLEATKRFFAEHGVDFDKGADLGTQQPRSKVSLLVKNIPHTLSAARVQNLFAKYGRLTRVLVPPTGTLALVEFEQPTEARAAFRALAYSRLEAQPIYLEWTPLSVLGPIPAHSRLLPISAEPAPTSSAGFVVDRKGGASEVEKEMAVESAGPSAGRTLFVKNLSFKTTDAQLRQHFETCGTVLSAVVARKAGKTGTSMGYGFVEFFRPDEALHAIKRLQGGLLDEHPLVLAFSRSSSSSGDSAASSSGKAKRGRDPSLGASAAKASAKLMVRNVAFEATKHELRDLFATFGELKNVRLPKKMDGSHRGFAFVEYVSPEVAREAFRQLQHTHLYGRHLVVEFSSLEDPSSSTTTTPDVHPRAPKRSRS